MWQKELEGLPINPQLNHQLVLYETDDSGKTIDDIGIIIQDKCIKLSDALSITEKLLKKQRENIIENVESFYRDSVEKDQMTGLADIVSWIKSSPEP